MKIPHVLLLLEVYLLNGGLYHLWVLHHPPKQHLKFLSLLSLINDCLGYSSNWSIKWYGRRGRFDTVGKLIAADHPQGQDPSEVIVAGV